MPRVSGGRFPPCFPQGRRPLRGGSDRGGDRRPEREPRSWGARSSRRARRAGEVRRGRAGGRGAALLRAPVTARAGPGGARRLGAATHWPGRPPLHTLLGSGCGWISQSHRQHPIALPAEPVPPRLPGPPPR